MSGISRDEWLSALREADPTSNPDALTRQELGAMLGLQETATKIRIRKLIADGKLVPAKKQITDASGRPQVVAAYLLTKPKRKRRRG